MERKWTVQSDFVVIVVQPEKNNNKRDAERNKENMLGVNLIFVFNQHKNKILMCERKKDPYKGKKNLVGGKIESGEDSLNAAYRELYEETGISRQDICLVHFMDFVFYLDQCKMEVFVGKLNKTVELIEEAHPLQWHTLDANFFDLDIFAGEGNIGHIMELIKQKSDILFLD